MVVINKKCTSCGTIFAARQSNYKTCSVKCSKEFNKLRQKQYYQDNKNCIIKRVSESKKIPQHKLTCIICSKSFNGRKSTQCCSDICRLELNKQKSTQRYHDNKIVATCDMCGKDFTSTNGNSKCRRCSVLERYDVESIQAANRERKRIYVRNKYKNDINFRLADNLRSRLNSAIRSGEGDKSGSAVRDLGCSIKDLKKHLEAQFKPGMSWDNWRRDGWHIDHIKPLSKFDLSDPEQLKEACHYSNLQPLWAEDNLRKGDKS